MARHSCPGSSSRRYTILLLLSVVWVKLQASKWWTGSTLSHVPGVQAEGSGKPARRPNKSAPRPSKKAPTRTRPHQTRTAMPPADATHPTETTARPAASVVELERPQREADQGSPPTEVWGDQDVQSDLDLLHHGPEERTNSPKLPAEGDGKVVLEMGPDTRVEGGKYKGMTFQELRAREPHYCHWAATCPSPPSWMVPLQRYLQQEARAPVSAEAAAMYSPRLDELGPTSIVGGGRYEGKTFEYVSATDPDYCIWVRAQPSNKLPGWGRALQQYLDVTSPPVAAAGSDEGMAEVEIHGGMPVGGGKFSDLTLEELVRTQPDYCNYLRGQANSLQAKRWMRTALKYLMSQDSGYRY
mmetsp:Transcript_45780/g.106320  ORF Transcript_45780/g.106320 Transcript_45780/m.106320 type:complete len:356 (+) Transcript_45780:79-1146(+)